MTIVMFIQWISSKLKILFKVFLRFCLLIAIIRMLSWIFADVYMKIIIKSENITEKAEETHCQKQNKTVDSFY